MTKMCYHPWVGLDISPQGEFKPCCKYKRTVGKTLDEYQSSTELKILQQEFLKGQQPEGCERCWRDEDAGLPSKRVLDNTYIFQNQTPTLDSLKVLSFPFGNTCNLACRICNSYSSSKWARSEQELKKTFDEIKIYSPSTFYKNRQFVNSIKDLCQDLIHLEIPGGEPFYADEEIHYDFLNHFKNPEKVSIHYTTNGTRYPDNDMLSLWDKFRQVDIQLSLDGTRQQFEYNRWPAAWPNVLFKLGKYLSLRHSKPNIKLSISHTVSIFTVYYLPEFLDWCAQYKLPNPYFGLLTKPLYYNIAVLPRAAKQAIEDKFKPYPQLKPIVEDMWANDYSDQLDTTIKYVKILDKQRNQSFANVFPELYNLLGERCQTLYQLY